jgi:hypothetical protein
MMHDRSDPAKLRYEMLPHELTVVFFEMGHPSRYASDQRGKWTSSRPVRSCIRAVGLESVSRTPIGSHPITARMVFPLVHTRGVAHLKKHHCYRLRVSSDAIPPQVILPHTP